MSKRTITLLFVAGLLFSACVNEPLYQDGSDLVDGMTTQITLSIKGDTYSGQEPQRDLLNGPLAFNPPALPANRSFASATEQKISNLHFLIFNAAGTKVVNEYITNPVVDPNTGISKVQFSAFTGVGMQIYVVANTDADTDGNLKDKFDTITSLNELKSVLVAIKSNGNGLSRAGRLTMMGNTTVNITQPHNTPISIQLEFLAAKATVTFTDATGVDAEITIDDWDIVNIPNKGYLIEKNQDAVSGSNADDYVSTADENAFETVDAVNKKWTQSIYLFENRRGGRVPRTLPDNPDERYDGMAWDDDNQRGKAWFAPAGATYMIVRGTYTKNGQTNNVVYKIYLGENPVNDYNIRRGVHYEYNVTVNGLNDINVDTNVEWGNSSFSVTASGDLKKMDAHPDFRVLRIGATAVDASASGYVTVEVLNDDNTTCSWLSVSPLNLYRYGIRQAGNAQQPFTNNEAGYFVGTKHADAVTSHQNFADATFSMTRKLTKIPFAQLAVYTFQDVVVYADANDGTAERNAKVRVAYYKDADETSPAVGQQIFDITQQAAIEISGDLFLEYYEESGMVLQPGVPSSLQGTGTAKMQWGYNGEMLYNQTDRYDNGNYLTANAIYQNVQPRNGMDIPTWNVATYVDYYRKKYPRTGTTEITEPSSLTNSGTPYYYPLLTPVTNVTEYFDPIYNTTAARYCHEKNRDTNGNGIIDAGEVFWYLPSLADMIHIAQNMPAGTSLTGTYWTSTEEDNGKAWAYTFPGTPEAKDKTDIYHVRCVRGKGVRMPEATLKSTEGDGTTMNLGFAAGANGVFNVEDITGLQWKVSSNASWLKIATDENGAGSNNEKIGTKNKSFFACAEANPDTNADRTAKITLQRDGMDDKIINVTQAKTTLATITPTEIELNYFAGDYVILEINAPGLAWTLTSDQSWLSIATNALGTNSSNSISGTGNKRLYAYAISKNESITNLRTASITLTQTGYGEVEHVNAKQKNMGPYMPDMHKGWAGSNIYWKADYINEDGTIGRLMFDDVNDYTHSGVQGVYFLWGSLVALTANYPAESRAILFAPSNLSEDGSTPYMNVDIELTYDSKRHYVLEYHDPQRNIGDICKYMTQRGWAPGANEGKKWRQPTLHECGQVPNPAASGYTALDSGNSFVDGTRRILQSGIIRKEFIFNGIDGTMCGYYGRYLSGTPFDIDNCATWGRNAQWVSLSLKVMPFGRSSISGVRCVLE